MLIDQNILKTRNPIVDIFRALAILLVVVFHFDHALEIGFIGVDLFFVISGYLVSTFFLKSFAKGEKTDWKTFLVKRFFKILPSYYFFILGGSLFAYLVLLPDHSSQVIPLIDFPKYLLFYLNYDMTFHWSFELAWSLCVEEHFYLFLTLLFLVVMGVGIKFRKGFLKTALISFIVLSFLFKLLGHYKGWDTYSATHMRMDALFLGVLLAYQREIEGKLKTTHIGFFLLGLFLCLTVIITFYFFQTEIFLHVFLHTIMPLSFYCLLRGSIPYKIKNSVPIVWLRIGAYYSYNWYLWHALTAYVVLNLMEVPKGLGFLIYFVGSFVLAVLTTKLIEEPFMKLRKVFIDRWL